MKFLMIAWMTTFVLLSSSCAARVKSAPNCPGADVRYVSSALDERGNRLAVFSIKNIGAAPIELPLENKSIDVVHGRYASTEQRSSIDDAWQAFNPLLDEMLAPKKNMTIAAGQQRQFKFDANGLFLDGPQLAGMEYSVVVKDASGCMFRSAPFKP